MNDDTRKLLTLFIGECWHEWPPGEEWKYPFYVYCINCGSQKSNVKANRPFTGPEDAQVVKDKMVEKGEWESFFIFSWDKFFLEQLNEKDVPCGWDPDHVDWLFSYYTDPSGNHCYRLCELAGEFLKGERR